MAVPLDFIRSTFEQDYGPAVVNQPISHSFDWDNFYSHANVVGGHVQSHEYYNPKKRQEMLQAKSVELARAAGDPSAHFERMESIFSGLLACQWRPEKLTQDDIVQQVDDILRRLPSPSTELPGSLDNLAPGYFTGNERRWEDLRVVSSPQKNLVRAVIYYILTTNEGGYVQLTLQEVLTHVGELIHICTTNRTRSRKHGLRNSRGLRKSFYVAGAYLWAFWQKVRTLFTYINLHFDLRDGFRHGMEKLQWVQDFSVSRKVSLRTLTDNAALTGKPANMCGWMLELLRGEPRSLGLDFSTLYSRFRDASGSKPARCRDSSPQGCSGDHWQQCRMFNRKDHLPDQSMHDDASLHIHDTENKVVWDEASYRSLPGEPRAVSISDSDENWLRPKEKALRTEAINFINTIFYTSRCVLVIDVDLMEFDVINMDTRQCECFLTAVLFSEWNTRAWTMLEALKGKDHVSILGRDDGTIRFMELLKRVYDHGRIDLVVFSTYLPHMMRSQGEAGTWLDHSSLRETMPNDIQLEVIGSWLSHRPVSREEDGVVIWSLCLNQKRQRIMDPEAFWRAQNVVQSGFLLSSAPRLETPGLRWAPSTPIAMPGTENDSNRPLKRPNQSVIATGLALYGTVKVNQGKEFHRAFESSDTSSLKIQADGIWGPWWTCEINLDLTSRMARGLDISHGAGRVIRKIRKALQINLQHMMLLRPMSETIASRLDNPWPQALVDGSNFLVAVCESDHGMQKQVANATRFHKPSYEWVWKGVFAWPCTVPLPEFEQNNNLWIS
ncbi:hypothetical protein PGQ11_009506 [Apiospora arundinis]|uniref:Uncharacterized protein n=1 Tax=Apiospora arundinis TaxID=335852 RepID=A0ABR2IIZ1_9PEZI